MAFPGTPVKDYEIIVNQTVTGNNAIDGTNAHEDRRQLLMDIKDQLVAAGTSNVGPSTGGMITPWVVEYSCDGITAGSAGDNVDRWGTVASLQWDTTGNAHGWMILSNTGVGIEICFDLIQNSDSSDGAYMTVVVSAGAGFTGGSTTARPTATDELSILAPSTVGWGSGTAGGNARDFVWDMWRTEDGEVTYVIIWYNNFPIGFWNFSKPQNPKAAWTGTQFVAAIMGTGEGAQTEIADWYDIDNLRTYRADRISTANTFNITNLYMTADTFSLGPFAQELTTTNDVSGDYAAGPIGLVCDQSRFVGRQGELFDLVWGQEVLGNPVDYYPSGASKAWIQIGDLIFPWEGSAAVTA